MKVRDLFESRPKIELSDVGVLHPVNHSAGAAAIPYRLYIIESDRDKIARVHDDMVTIRVYTDKGRYDHHLKVYLDNDEESLVLYRSAFDIRFIALRNFKFDKIKVSPPFDLDMEITMFENINTVLEAGKMSTIKFDKPNGVMRLS